MASLVKYGKHGGINEIDTTTMGYYMIKFVSEAYTLQYYTIREGNIISDGELVVKAHYTSCMKENKKFIGIGKISNKLSLFQNSLLYIYVLMLCQ